MLVQGARLVREGPFAGRGRRIAPRLALALVAGTLLVPGVAAAAPDPSHVNFTIEGCRLDPGDSLPNASGAFVCTDDDYTTGNLGKNWNELDLVPHRLTASTGEAQTYTMAIAADNRDAGVPGYDVISIPVVNDVLSSGDCSLTAAPAAAQPGGFLTPGIGGTDTTIYRMLTITQSAGSTCVFDYYERLALGSAGFPGSSLHSNLMNQQFGTAGIGARDVPIPVNEILPQQLAKTMRATTGSTTAWNVTKDSSPTDLSFQTCATDSSAQAQGVTITINWTKSTVVASKVTLVSNITITNPAHRTIHATVTDKMYSGTNQVNQVGSTYTSPLTVIPAESSVTLTNTQSVSTGATRFNDVATATYTDQATGFAVPGTTTASAQADLVTISTPNATATVSDTEVITGAGLSFSLDSTTPSPTGGFAGGYVLGTKTTGLTWTLPGVTTSGSIVLHKTVHVDGDRNTSGTLSDVATLVDSAGTTHTAAAATKIVARACIRGQKFNDANLNGTKNAGEAGVAGVTVYLDVNGDGMLDTGEPSAVTGADGNFVISTVTVADGTHKLREVVPTGQTCSFPSPCSHTVIVGPGTAPGGLDFGNHVTPPPPPVVTPPAAPPPPPPPAQQQVLQNEVVSPPPPPAPVPAPVVVTGRAKLQGPTRCVARKFTAFVTGRRIARVRFYVDGKLVATLTKANGPNLSYERVIDPATYSRGKHRVVARVKFLASSQTKEATQTIVFSRCARAAKVVKFTG